MCTAAGPFSRIAILIAFCFVGCLGCSGRPDDPVTSVSSVQSPSKPANASIERMLENSEGILSINASLLVEFIDQIEQHDIRNLTVVQLNREALDCLPRLKGLETLRLEWLRGYPGMNAQLERPDLTPLGQLKDLKSLTFAPRSAADLAPLRKLKRLEALDLQSPYGLQRTAGLPDLTSLKNLSRLKSLTIRNLKADGQLVHLADMDELEEVEFHACPGLRDLKPLAGKKKLKKLTFFACSAMTDLQPLASLENLETIEFDSCPGISDMRPLANLKKLRSISFDRHAPDLSPLATTPIESIELGESIELRGHSNLSNVTSLVLNADSTFDDLASMPNLKSVRIRGYAANEHVLEALAGCESLEHLECFPLLETTLAPIATLCNLRELVLQNLQCAVDDLRPLAELKELSSLQLRWHHSLEDLRPLDQLKNLKHLDLFTKRPTGDLNGLATLNQLESLEVVIWGDSDLKPLADLTNLRRLVLKVFDAEELDNLGALAKLQNLEELHLELNRGTDYDLTPLGNVRGLKSLRISSCPGPIDLSPLVKLQELASILLISCRGEIDLNPLGEISGLERLTLYECTAVRDVSPLAKIVGLKFLNLRECSNAANLGDLATLTNLEDLAIPPSITNSDLRKLVQSGLIKNRTGLMLKAPHLTDLSPLASMTKLEKLILEDCYPVDLSPLADLGLTELAFRNCHSRRPQLGDEFEQSTDASRDDTRLVKEWDFAPLARLQSLQDLSISHCRFPVDFEPIAELKGLKTLWWDFHDNDFEPLLPVTKLTHLRYIGLEGASNITKGEVVRLRRMMPQTHVDGTEIVE
jgi:Leucine-rich repeat (LRR) protein